MYGKLILLIFLADSDGEKISIKKTTDEVSDFSLTFVLFM